MVRNELIALEREMYDKLWMLIVENDNIKEKDLCFEKLYKYTRSEITLKESNNNESVKFYKNIGKTNLRNIYLWNQKGSLDILIRG